VSGGPSSKRIAFFDPFTIRFQAAFDEVQVFGSQAFAPRSFSLDLTPMAGGQ
jgi:hypothetical protein